MRAGKEYSREGGQRQTRNDISLCRPETPASPDGQQGRGREIFMLRISSHQTRNPNIEALRKHECSKYEGPNGWPVELTSAQVLDIRAFGFPRPRPRLSRGRAIFVLRIFLASVEGARMSLTASMLHIETRPRPRQHSANRSGCAWGLQQEYCKPHTQNR